MTTGVGRKDPRVKVGNSGRARIDMKRAISTCRRLPRMVTATWRSLVSLVALVSGAAASGAEETSSKKESGGVQVKRPWSLSVFLSGFFGSIRLNKISAGVFLVVVGVVAHHVMGAMSMSSYGVPVSDEEAGTLFGAGQCIGTTTKSCSEYGDDDCEGEIVLPISNGLKETKPVGDRSCCDRKYHCWARTVACFDETN